MHDYRYRLVFSFVHVTVYEYISRTKKNGHTFPVDASSMVKLIYITD